MARLSNLSKLYLVPVFATREMLLNKLANDEVRLGDVGRMNQEALIKEIDHEYSIGEGDIDQLYEMYRYGRKLSLQLFLLPDEYALNEDDETIERLIIEAIDEAEATTEPVDGSTSDDGDYNWDEPNGRVTICDHVRFGDVLEIRFKYPVLHRYLDIDELPRQIIEIRYGYVWLCPAYGYLAVLAKDDAVAKIMLEIISAVLNLIPTFVKFPKDLIDRHFQLTSVRRLSHLNPHSGVRRSISGSSKALSVHMDEIADRDRENLRPGALYDERIDESFSSGLGITSSKGRLYFTRTLSTSQVQSWRESRLHKFVTDLRATLATRPLEVRLSPKITRILKGLGQKEVNCLQELLNAVRYVKVEELDSVQLNFPTHELYQALGSVWLQAYLACDCPNCGETCGLCPNCGQSEYVFEDEQLRCATCQKVVSDDGVASFLCINDHIHHFEIGEALGYVPTKKLLLLIKEYMLLEEQHWDNNRHRIYIDSAGLHYIFTLPDTTINNVYGDFIQAEIGSGASNVSVGKNINSGGGENNGNQEE